MTLLGILASASAPPPTSPVAGYKAWYDASDTATITVSGNAVTQWNDKSANAYNLTQGTAAYRPSSGTRTINSKNVIDFDGSNDLLKAATASNWTFLSNSGGSSFFLVILCDTSSTFQVIWSTLFDLSSSSVGTTFTRRTDDKTDLFVRNGNSGNGAIGSNDQGTLTDATAIYYTALLSPNNGTTADRAISRVNGGAEIKNNTFTQSPSASVASEPLHIGDYTPGGGLGFDGAIGEVLFYDSVLSATDRAKNESYLKNKWGL